jgi:hypothetical protein
MSKLEQEICEGFSSQYRRVEGEQLYRRGCEYLYGPNRDGEGGETSVRAWVLLH